MIDTHSHIVPYLDDGPRTLNESVSMAELALREGITKVIATPHHANGHFDNDKSKVIAAVNQLNQRLAELKLPVTVIPGQEIHLYRELLDDYLQGKVMTLGGGNYMLIELPSDTIPPYLFELVHELKLLNVQPVIAHPERNRQFVKHPELFAGLVKDGVLGQLTVPSVLGKFGKKTRDFSIHLCKSRMIHLLASDAHDLLHRPPSFRQADEVLSRKVGTDFVNALKRNAELITENEQVPRTDPMLKTGIWWLNLKSPTARTRGEA
ncbi:tyrosine-protein phosphatase [Gordoniibacillus kamchatkensis]|uniref:tyrosine-protein phosphatase n=1 Tax=Gordoniibacillus kamchatkensis TaxID=1590651 RepID=UPI000697431C|nr:CpsB/CapC family capsule biosynthesis tyrosine phosphatase [Paenibacillus sp. VKM B-2647]